MLIQMGTTVSKMKTTNMEKIINGYWDGEPIWRYKTAGEVLLEAISEHDEIINDKQEQDYATR